MKRRLFLASAGLLTAPSLARAQQRGITLLVPFAEGGSVSVYDPNQIDAIVNQYV